MGNVHKVKVCGESWFKEKTCQSETRCDQWSLVTTAHDLTHPSFQPIPHVNFVATTVAVSLDCRHMMF